MESVCCMTGCTMVPSEDLYYFKLPTKPTLRRRWLEVIKPDYKLSLDASVCSAHFATTDYETVRGKTRLKRNKVPMMIEETKPQSSDDETKQKRETTRTGKKTRRKTSNSIKENGTKSEKKTEHEKQRNDSEKQTRKCEKPTESDCKDEKISEGSVDGDTRSLEMASQNREEIETDAEVDRNCQNSVCDPNSIEIQITPDIIEDYSSMQVTPDIIDDYDAMKPPDPMEPDINHDIEDILTNYHIMNPPSRRDREQTSEKPSEEGEKHGETVEKPNESGEKPVETDKNCEKPIDKPSDKSPDAEEPTEKPSEIPAEKPSEKADEKPSEKPNDEVQTIDDDDDLPLGVSSKPVFIEIPVDKDPNPGTGGDCLMVLESLQVNIDPSTLMLSERDEDIEEIEIGDDTDDDEPKSRDPISLLTSSDEDDVIIEEPHIDTVVVSDDTDEDDMPLVRLVKSDSNVDISKIFWGAHDYYCNFCAFCTLSPSQYRSHMKTHTTKALQICQICGFTTASEAQFTRHKKKHKDERRHKCHLCDYKARHNMSLIYHLKTHKDKTFRCKNCSFTSDVSSRAVKHARVCRKVKVHSCSKCGYSTRRGADLRRHALKRHQDSDGEWA